MHKEGKVVPLAAAIDRGARTPSPSLPVLLLQVRDKAALQLREGLQALFDNADDTLFEMADKAGARVDQNLYFEAMRDLRLKRKSIERGFLDLFYEAFALIGQNNLFDSLMPTPLACGETELERAIVVQGMVDRVLSRDGFFLQQLNQRFAALLDRDLDERRNPLGPASLCDYFLAAGRNLGVGTSVKMVLLKLFERYVLRDLDLLYGEAGQLLASAGVLPDLQPAPRRRAEDLRDIARRVPANPVQAGGAGADAAGQAFFASVQGFWHLPGAASRRACRPWARRSRSARATCCACSPTCSITCLPLASRMTSTSASSWSNCCCGSACVAVHAGVSPPTTRT